MKGKDYSTRWERIKGRIKTEPLLCALIGFLVFLAVLVLAVMLSGVVEKCVSQLLGLAGASKKYEVLKSLVIVMGGVLLTLQALASHRRAKAMEGAAKAQADSVKVQAKAVREQAKANQDTEQGRRQERLKDAIDHLGNASDSVRLGSAHELFQLAQDTPDFRVTVLSILCAHIRRTTGEDEYRKKYKAQPSEEIQSLLTLLFVQEHEVFTGLHINLQGSWLNGADLMGARLVKTVLKKAHLQGADLRRADLRRADLRRTDLQEADLQEADLRRTDLRGARVWDAFLQRASLQRARLQGANLQGSILNEARLHRAILIDTDLRYAGLNGTYLQGANLAIARLQKASLGGAYLQGAFLYMAQLYGATLTDAQLQGAYLGSAQLHEVQFSSLQGLQHLDEKVRQEIDPQPAQLQGVSSSAFRSFDVFRERIRERKDKETDLSGVVFSGGLTKQNVDSLVKGLSEAGAKELRETLEPHIDQPISHELPENSGAITGTYTAEEAEQWIAEYNEAMLEVPTESDN